MIPLLWQLISHRHRAQTALCHFFIELAERWKNDFPPRRRDA